VVELAQARAPCRLLRITGCDAVRRQAVENAELPVAQAFVEPGDRVEREERGLRCPPIGRRPHGGSLAHAPVSQRASEGDRLRLAGDRERPTGVAIRQVDEMRACCLGGARRLVAHALAVTDEDEPLAMHGRTLYGHTRLRAALAFGAEVFYRTAREYSLRT